MSPRGGNIGVPLLPLYSQPVTVKQQPLTSEEREFFALLTEVIFSNPFSFQKDRLASLGSQIQGPTPVPDDHHYSALIPPLEQWLARLESRGLCRIQAVPLQDRRLLQYAFLFQLYDRYVAQWDQLIQTQMVKGAAPAPVPFAEELIDKLQNRGFSIEEAGRYLALFYQLRRAYFFIAHALVGDSPSMTRLRHALWNNVFTTDARFYADHLWDRMEDFSTLLLGETGTGKGSAAAAIGRSGLIPFDLKSRRFTYSFTETFIAINLSQFPESLIESELFGHRKGAFTGAIDNHKGLFQRCSPHGALFLDEIGDVSVPVQIKLLNVLQERQFTPVGSHSPLRFAGRVIAATHRSLPALRREGQFRDDFYYRLSSDVIEVPPLRRRLQESPAELKQLVGLLAKRLTGQAAEDLIDRILQVLNKCLPADYAWPGNVRELEQAVRRIILKGDYQGAEAPTDHGSWLCQATQGKLSAPQLLAAYCQMLYRRHGTYEAVATITALDRRTVKKHVQAGASKED
ncbi:sigma-54-dependent transcriptional regulator [Nitrosococcus wardiae]|uniref:Sigma-54-dependent Fis family transcriptional regulator n=1 Tax=Nitrosococcus wardiae TaxID=1814290 RepID=A0A4P7BZ16_9GAMM|nr:sigma 54-interacting transcriptional regulator [Nitrosococcus wardiae]QBQ55448.1 sigma-54-dependent Fis family transcriptional regulator [Nitrosococcus wardiae]